MQQTPQYQFGLSEVNGRLNRPINIRREKDKVILSSNAFLGFEVIFPPSLPLHKQIDQFKETVRTSFMKDPEGFLFKF